MTARLGGEVQRDGAIIDWATAVLKGVVGADVSAAAAVAVGSAASRG